MTSASFLLQNSLRKVQFIEETFLLANASMKVVLGMLFLSLCNADLWFDVKELIWRSYTAAEALPTTSRVEFIDQREFAKAALDENLETFFIHVAALETTKVANMAIYLLQAAQIATLLWDKASTKISAKYTD